MTTRRPHNDDLAGPLGKGVLSATAELNTAVPVRPSRPSSTTHPEAASPGGRGCPSDFDLQLHGRPQYLVGWHRWTLGWGNSVEAPQALCLNVHSCWLSRVDSCTVEDKTGALRGANISVFFHDLILSSPKSSNRHHTSSCCALHLVDNPGFMSTPPGGSKPQALGRNALSFSTLPHALSLSLLGA